jgi:hypothetical protein
MRLTALNADLGTITAGFVDKTERVSRHTVNGRGERPPAPAVLAAPEQTEEQIHRAVVQLLDRAAVAGVFSFHVPNGEARGPGIGGKLKAMGTRPGMPDVCILFLGRFYGLEIKKRGGKVSPAQRMAHAQMVACGAEVRTVYDLDEAIAALKDWGMIR